MPPFDVDTLLEPSSEGAPCGEALDFSPTAVARNVPALQKLLEARMQLSNLLTYMDGKTGAENLVTRLLNDPAMLRTLCAAPKPVNDGAETPVKSLNDGE